MKLDPWFGVKMRGAAFFQTKFFQIKQKVNELLLQVGDSFNDLCHLYRMYLLWIWHFNVLIIMLFRHFACELGR